MELGRAFKAADIVAFLEQLRREYPPAQKIGVFLDNASIHRAPMVLEAAERLNIELLFNLAYRPDLNGIETYWRDAKASYRRALTRYRANHQSWDQLGLVQHCCLTVPEEQTRYYAQRGWEAIEAAKPIMERPGDRSRGQGLASLAHGSIPVALGQAPNEENEEEDEYGL